MVYVAYIWLKFMVNAGKYTSPIEPMGNVFIVREKNRCLSSSPAIFYPTWTVCWCRLAWMSQEVSKWVITPIYPISKYFITHLQTIDPSTSNNIIQVVDPSQVTVDLIFLVVFEVRRTSWIWCSGKQGFRRRSRPMVQAGRGDSDDGSHRTMQQVTP